jgi:catechol 2,3-dioxygenase-like lactoylglutathione lyase family enzyme
VIAFVATTDSERARGFYEAALGLSLLRDEPFALVFDAHGTTLRVQKVRALEPAPYTVLGWKVPDVRATVSSLAARGIRFERYPGLMQDDVGVWTSPGGARVAWFKDPDGNVLSLTQD